MLSATRRPLAITLLAAFSASGGGTGCHAPTDLPLPAGAERFAPPPVYTRWWAMTEACSGITRPLAAVTWYHAPGPLPVSDHGQSADGYWSPPSNRIVLHMGETLDGTLVRHEMLHALLRAPGHPRDGFLDRCAALVGCTGPCVRDAGPGPRPDPAAAVVPPTALRFSLAVDPPPPAGEPVIAPGDGFLTFTVRVRNPAPYPVVVRDVAGPGGGAGYLPGFGYIVMGPARTTSIVPQADDSASTVFAPGETRAAVFDFAVAPAFAGLGKLPELGYNGVALGRGHYTLSGTYGRMWSDTVGVTVAP